MTIEQIKSLVDSEQYDFLRTNEHLGDNIFLLGLGGSHAYGTNTETSDVDIRGIALNRKEDILSYSNFEQFVNESTDTTIYGFNKMIELLSNCNPNTIEILGLRPEQYLILTSTGEELLRNRHMFLSRKAISTFGGYANQQLYRLNQISSHSLLQPELEEHILRTVNNLIEGFTEKYHISENDFVKLFIDKSNREEMSTEIFMDINLHKYPLRDYAGMWNEFQNIVKSYNKIGRRNDHAVEHGKIAKHMMHLIRLYYMCLDILLKEEINTYREDEHDFLMAIRDGEFITEDNQVKPEFFKIVESLESDVERAKEITKLPARPDYKKIKEFVIKVNMSVVQREL